MTATDFTQRLSAAGLMKATGDPQQAAIGDLIREHNADSAFVSWPPERNGDRRITLWVHGDATPVCRATVGRDGEVLQDVTEVIA